MLQQVIVVEHTACACNIGLTNTHASQGQGLTKRREDQRKKDCVPTNTLFVVNFDPGTTRERDLEKHFSQYGKLTRVQVKKNFGFVAFESLDDAVDARVACGNGVRFQGMILTAVCLLGVHSFCLLYSAPVIPCLPKIAVSSRCSKLQKPKCSMTCLVASNVPQGTHSKAICLPSRFHGV